MVIKERKKGRSNMIKISANYANAVMNQEICVACGESVAPGSGKFCNRVPVWKSYTERKHLYSFPTGCYACEECDSKHPYKASAKLELIINGRDYTNDLKKIKQSIIDLLENAVSELNDSDNPEGIVKNGDTTYCYTSEKLVEAISETIGELGYALEDYKI
jgi:hypothetical protein